MKTSGLTPLKINIISLGCSKNLVDSEYLMRQLQGNKVELIHDKNTTDVDCVIINTCGFINDAKQESIDTILQFARARKNGRPGRLFVMGCLSERYKIELCKEIPEVDGFFGVNEIPTIINSIGLDYKKELVGERYLTTPTHFAYLKISEGCDRHCAFCAIPGIRGNHRSKTEHELLGEAYYLANLGVKEVILIAQDLTYYGRDLTGKPQIFNLLDKLSSLNLFKWIRLHYAYPTGFPLDLLDLMRERDSICNYLDIPFQHVSDKMLKSMKRGINRKNTIKLIDTIREKVPGIALRTSLLVGHPGETTNHFNELKQFVKDTKFERMGVFSYSHEENTHAYNNYEDDIPVNVKQKRAEELMGIQSSISLENNKKLIGRELNALVDKRIDKSTFIARTEYDSPEVDNEVILKPGKTIPIVGDFCRVKITGAGEYELYAVTI